MGKVSLILTVISLLFTFSSCNPVWTDASQLQPVQGLYIKPSADGTTGDLFVAATENSGTKSQWLTDQPIGLIPATQLKPTTLPLTVASSSTKSSTTQEESASIQKRTVSPSPPNYAYALPIPTSDGNVLAAYPFAVASNTDGATPKWPEGIPTPPCSTAFQYFYPQMVAAMSRAMSTFAGAATNDKGFNSAGLSVPPFWPQTYSYPYQYLMVDPNAWAQRQLESTTPNETEANSDESFS